MSNLSEITPDIKISVNQIFGIDTDMKIDAFSKSNLQEGGHLFRPFILLADI